jgi:hypothetical protein
MLKTLLAATTALTLMSGIGFTETTYSDSATKSTTGISTPLGGVAVSKTTKTSRDDNGMTVEKNKAVSKDFDHDRDHAMNRDLDRHDGMMAEKDKTVAKDTTVAPNGDVSKHKSETTTIR